MRKGEKEKRPEEEKKVKKKLRKRKQKRPQEEEEGENPEARGEALSSPTFIQCCASWQNYAYIL